MIKGKSARSIIGWSVFSIIALVLTAAAAYPQREPLSIAASAILNINVFIGIIGGAIIGIIIGVLPGISPVAAIAVLMPLTFGLDTQLSMYFLVSIIGSSHFAGSIPSILLNVPGDPPNAATCIDGYPMARKGEGGRALGISAMASFMGAVIGLVVLIVLLPVVRAIVLAFSSPEFFWLALLALVSVAFAIQSNMLKGLFAGGLGVLVALIGASSVAATLRFTGGSYFLYDGLELAPLLMGVIALSQMFELQIEGEQTIAQKVGGKITGVWRGCLEVFRYPANFVRSSIIGVIIGILPGVGGTAAGFISYGSTATASRHPETFGKGDPEGVMAPQLAITAERGGALLPTVAFGIPGSVVMALMLGAFMLHGIVPGPLLVRDHLDIIWALIFGLAISGTFSSVLGLVTAPYLAKIAEIKSTYLIPLLVVLCAAGAYVIRGSLWDVPVVLLAGAFGYGLEVKKFPVICFIMGYILGTMAETSYLQTLMSSYGSYTPFFTRPISIVLVVCLVALIGYPIFQSRRKTSKEVAA